MNAFLLALLFLLASVSLLSTCASAASASSASASASASAAPHFTLHPASQLSGSPHVTVVPLRVARGRNIFTFGATTHVTLGVKLRVPIVAGATAEAWLSSLSLGSVARVAANKFIPYTDVCTELERLPAPVRRELALPASCPVKKLHQFSFDRVLRADFWEAIETYVSRKRVVGATGVLEVRLWSKKPCTACFTGPTLLAGFSLPFEVAEAGVPRPRAKKKKAEKKKKKKKEGNSGTGTGTGKRSSRTYRTGAGKKKQPKRKKKTEL